MLVQLSIYRKLFTKYRNDASSSSRKLGDHESIRSETGTLESSAHMICERDTGVCGSEAIRYDVESLNVSVCKCLLDEEGSVIEILVSLQ